MKSIGIKHTFLAAALIAANCAAFAADETAAVPVWQFIDNSKRLSASPGCKYVDNKEAISLEDGTLLIELDDPVPVTTPLCAIKTKGQSLLLIKCRAGLERVFVLLGTATIITQGHKSTFHEGEEAIVANHEQSYAELIGEDYIGRRRLRVTKLPEGHAIATTEFSLVHAMERESSLYPLAHSTQDHDRALKERLIKTATILHLVTGSHGQYQTGRR